MPETNIEDTIFYSFLKQAWIGCWREYHDTYYKGEPMSGIYVKTETMTDTEVFEIIKNKFNEWAKDVLKR